MPLYCICCELADASPFTAMHTAGELRRHLPTLGEVVAGLGPCMKVAPMTWFLETSLELGPLMEKFHPYVFASEERILVFPLTKGTIWGSHSGSAEDKVVEWLQVRLPE